MAQLSFNDLVNGIIPDASDFNTRFNALKNRINNGMEADNIADATITTAKLVNDSVTGDKIADDAVSINHMAANSVGTAELVDNSVTGAKIALANQAQGDVMYYDGTDWVRLAPSTSGFFLKTMGAAANPVWADTGTGSTLSQSGTVTGGANFSISSLAPGVRYKIIFNLLQNTSAGYLTLTANGDGGSNYMYSWIGGFGSDFTKGGSNGTTSMVIGSTATVSATTAHFGVIELMTVPSDDTAFNLNFRVAEKDASNFIGKIGSGFYNGASALSSITIATSAGTVTGSWKLYIEN